jgi:membrane protein implicated in regulation of membrane protease activity
MMELFGKLLFWHWWILGVLLLGLEILVPGQFFLWMGISAGLVGGIILVGPNLGWEIQLVLFGVLSVLSIGGWRLYQNYRPPQSDQPMLNRRGSQYVGQTFVLSKDMPMGRGTINVDDTTWRAVCDSGEDLPLGSRVKVIGIDGTTLKVEPA